MVSYGAGLGINMATGVVEGVAQSALKLAGSSQGNMQHSNPYNASASIMGHRQPYLLIERAVSNYPTSYAGDYGYPLYVTKSIGSCKGFTVVDSVNLDGIPCTQAEKEKIRQMLRSGVIIK